MKIRARYKGSNIGIADVAARCPHRGREAVLESLNVEDTKISTEHSCGQRRCPNPECQGHIFVVLHNGILAAAYPPIRIDFDPQNLPPNVLEMFEEAVTCHSQGCFVAAAIMVRRTLEEVCKERAATGKDLKERLQSLSSKIVLPKELMEAMDDLRFLGNDAAHVEATTYDNVSDDEVTIAMEITKEILKSLYQYTALIGKLRALKKKP